MRQRLSHFAWGLAASAAVLAGLVPVITRGAADGPLTPEEASAIARDAYIYGYPLVTMELTRRLMTNVPISIGKLAPMGQFAHLRTYPKPTDKAVTTPNADTLYSLAWLDLSTGPYVLSLPDAGDRYYLMPMLSAWTEVFASPGTRTTGTKAQTYAITGPGWKGNLPEGVKRVEAPTNMVWILGRTYCTGTTEDYAQAHAFQDQIKLVPLSAYGKAVTSPKGTFDRTIDMKTPVRDQINRMSGPAFFQLLAKLLKNNPPAAADAPIIAQMARIGIIPGQDFDPSKLSADVRNAVDEAPEAALEAILEHAAGDGKIVNGWQYATQTGRYGTDYLQRALIAAFGLGANLPEDAVYPHTDVDQSGEPLDGSQQYIIRFPKDQLPPVNAFWSITLYGPSYFFVANPLNRYSISLRTNPKFNEDGSLDLYVQNESPGKDKENNWLPAPRDHFVLFLRMYWPKPAVLDMTWKPPAVMRRELVERAGDVAAIRALGEAFKQAYDKGDAKAVVGTFTADAEVTNEEGAMVRGRDAITEHFAAGFETTPGETIELKSEDLHFLGPDVAREVGTARTVPKDAPPETTRYSAILVRENGRWLQASVHEYSIVEEPVSAHERLKELEWLVGDWVDENDEGVVQTNCHWSEDGNYLLRDFTVNVTGIPIQSGTQRIGWDPRTSQCKSWIFDPDGGFSEGLWSHSGPDQWTIHANGALGDGRAVVATQVLTRVSKDIARWRSINRTIGGQAIPDLPEIVLVRRPPPPGGAKTGSK